MKSKSLLISLIFAAAVGTASLAGAATFTTGDGVLSIETPTEAWQQLSDPNYWFAVSDGANTITVDHLSNGESLPTVQVADATYPAVYQAFVSTQNEVFVVKGLAKSSSDLQKLMETISTVKVLKYDTKTAIAKQVSQVSEFGLRAINATYYVVTDELNVRNGCSTDSSLLGVLGYGDAVTVNGMVTKNGSDYGWYQIAFNNGVAYVSANFLSTEKPSGSKTESKPAQSESSSEQSGSSSSSAAFNTDNYESMTLYAEDGRSVTVYYIPSSGLYMDADGSIFSPMAGGLSYEASTGTYWNADSSFWTQHTSSEFNYDEFAEQTSELTDADTPESSFTVYSEDGNFKEITHYMPSDVYEDRHGLILEPMAGSLFYEPSTGIYWDADPDYWKQNSSEDLDYDDFLELFEADQEASDMDYDFDLDEDVDLG